MMEIGFYSFFKQVNGHRKNMVAHFVVDTFFY